NKQPLKKGLTKKRYVSIVYHVPFKHGCVKQSLTQCGKQVKCPVAVANEMSGLRVGAEIKGHLMRRCGDVTLSGPSTGAGNEDTGSDFAGSQWEDSVDASG